MGALVMLLGRFWALLGRSCVALGAILGALGEVLGHAERSWGLLGFSWGLSGASRSTKRGLQFRLGTPLGLVCSLLAAEDGLESVPGPSLSRFWCSRGPFGGCLGIRQTDFNH